MIHWKEFNRNTYKNVHKIELPTYPFPTFRHLFHSNLFIYYFFFFFKKKKKKKKKKK